MSYNDDEQPPENSSAGAAGPRLRTNAERVRLVAHCNDKAPLEENRQQVLLQITDTTTSSTAERSGLDLVAVLDVSGSMSGGKLDKLKTAMKFVISKLGPLDRLSIVSFSNAATRLCQLRSMTDACKEELKGMVENRLEADGWTNMHAGLDTGLKILDGRQHKSGRVGSVLFMSDGMPAGGYPDVMGLSTGGVAVYTFGFGADKDEKERSTAVLEGIAGKSLGGTFYNVDEKQNLSEHFSALLSGLLSVVVEDLKLTVWEQPGHSKIHKVDAGSYQTNKADAGPFVVEFGYLYSGEVRNVMVDLDLPAVGRAYRAPVLTAHCTYSIKGRTFYSPRDRYLSCSISRTGSAKAGAMESEEVKVELIRRRHADKLGEAIQTKGMDVARGKLVEADTALRAERSRHALLDLLKAELAKLLMLTTWEDLVACLRAAKRSHDSQRFASRGDVGVTIFQPRRMLEYVDQARKFDEDPSRPPPSVEEERSVAEAADDRHRPQEQPRRASRVWAGRERSSSSSGWAWATVLLCTALAVGVILAGVAVFAVYLLYRPSMPYLEVSDALLERLQYGQDGAIDYLQASITVVAVNNNSKADASFSSMDLVVGFHGADVALLRAQPFVVLRESSVPLPYHVVSAGRALDAAGMQAMDEALKAGVVPFDLFGKARTRWKVGVFANLRFWMRVSCRLRFFFPGNGTVMATDRDKCRSR